MMAGRLLLLLNLLLLTACAVSPTGRQQLLFMQPQQLDRMGATAFQQMVRQEPVLNNPRINAQVSCIAQAVVAPLGRGHWQVAVFRDDEANAFALPGGYIGVNSGMLNFVENQDQLAAVLAHEVGHVLAQHQNERASQQVLLETGLGLANARGVNPTVVQALGLGAQYGILLPYSREHESEADLIGLDLMARAGFDPRQSLQLWANMARSERNQSSEFLSTHPSHQTRLRELDARLGPALAAYEDARRRGINPRCVSRR